MVEYVEKRRREIFGKVQKFEFSENPEENNTMPITAVQTNSSIANQMTKDIQLLEYLVDVERKVRRIRDSRTLVPEFFYDNCKAFEQIFNRQTNLIEFSEQFSIEMPMSISETKAQQEFVREGLIFRRPRYLALDMLLAFEIAKTMPFFELLETGDKICLLSTVTMPLLVLSNGFYSWQQNADAFITPIGYSPVSRIAQFHNGNELAQKLAIKVMCRAMIPFIRANLSIEEFVLLRAIIYSHMVASGLSVNSQQILLQEAAKYSSLLLKFLQTKYGQFSGVRKYVELLSLVEFCFNSGAQHRQWLTMANLMGRNQFGQVMPPILGQLCTQGPTELPQLAPL